MDEFGDRSESESSFGAAGHGEDGPVEVEGGGVHESPPQELSHLTHGESGALEPGATADSSETMGWSAAQEPASAGRPRRTALVVGVVAVIVIAVAATIGVVATHNGSSGPGAGVTPAAFVVSSTQNTFSHHTADVVIAGTVSGKGKNLPITGSGAANFDTNGFTCDVTTPLGTHSLVEHEIETGNHMYMGITVDGQDASAITGGPRWIDVPLPDQHSSSLGAGSVDPLSQLQLLEKKGATVRPLGTSTIGGATVSGYAVTISAAEEQKNLQEEIQSGAIPQSVVPQAEQELKGMGTPTIDVYIDGAKLLRQMTFTTNGGSSGITVKMNMTFDHFGTPVTIAAPSSGDVVSFSQFVKDLQAMEGTAG